MLWVDFGAEIEDRPAEPRPEALAEGGQHLFLLVENCSFADDLAKGRPAAGHFHLAEPHGAAWIVDELLADAVDPRAMIAECAQTSGQWIDLGFEEIVADGVLVGQPHPQCGRRRAGWAALRNPCEAKSRHFDNEPGLVAVKLRRLERAFDRQRATDAVQLQGDSPGETARIQQQVTGAVADGPRQ